MNDQDLSELRHLFEVMERLRAPGGCPWDRVQSHQSLVPYLLEETYEAIQAIEEGTADDVAEELGDLLVEVAMQVAIAAEAGEFDIATVAGRATEKMIGRHPHVFGDLRVAGVEQVLSNWEELKRQEKPERESPLDGIPAALPALALASAIQRRQGEEMPEDRSPDPLLSVGQALSQLSDGKGAAEAQVGQIGELLYRVVALARERGVDPEGALRGYASERRRDLRQAQLARRQEESSAAPLAAEGSSNSG